MSRWLQFCDDDENSGHDRRKALLRHRLHLSFARSIIKQLFDCIVDYPDSKPALFDLKDCLKRVSLRAELVCSLQDDIMNRLLHPGWSIFSGVLVVFVHKFVFRCEHDSGVSGVHSVCKKSSIS